MKFDAMKKVVTMIGGLVLSACTLGGMNTETAGDKQSEALLFADHPLAEKVWDVKAQRFVDKAQLLADAVQSDYLLLGETHDNDLHHRYEAWILDGLAMKKRSAAVSFEMITREQMAPLAAKQPSSTDALIALLNKSKTNWGYERYYRPVFDSVLGAAYSVYPASLGRKALMGIARGGDQHIPADIQALLRGAPFTSEQEASLREEIKQSHCGMLDDRMAVAMVLTQRVKDAVMAESLIQRKAVETRVLVAGSGHGRKDRGVPLYLRAQAADAKVLSIAWIEVVSDMGKVADYAQAWGSTSLPYDYVWFTARVDRPDPCESFKRHMHKKKTEQPKQGTDRKSI
jgi:uncharacterized iron-regulated protein